MVTESSDCERLLVPVGFEDGRSLLGCWSVSTSTEVLGVCTYTDLLPDDLVCVLVRDGWLSGIDTASADLVSEREDVDVGDDGGETNGFVAICPQHGECEVAAGGLV